MTEKTWPRPYSEDELWALIHRHRTIGMVERKWSFARNEQGQKVLLPATYPPYLFRGQSKRHVPCFPSMYRHIKTLARYMWEVSEADAMRIVADATRTFWYYSELERHPIFKWAKANKLYLPELELAQHYGIPTALLDLTESIEVALFFATHEFKDGMFHPCTSGTGILYVVDRTKVPKGLVTRFTSVASQPFLRPLRQWAWTCELLMGECFEDCPSLGAIQFEQSESLANRICVMAEAEGDLFPPDPLADIAANINASKVLPAKYVKTAREFYEEALPDEKFGCIGDALFRTGHNIEAEAPTVFSNASLAAIDTAYEAAIATWQTSTFARMEQLCVRGGRGTGKPLEYGVLERPSVEVGEWKIVPVPHYGSLLDE